MRLIAACTESCFAVSRKMSSLLALDATGPGTRYTPEPRADDAQSWIGAMAGEYRLERVLGRGGMGTVYAARHPVIDKRVAVKVLATRLACDPLAVRRFIDEARAVNRISHPGIVDIFAFGQLPRGPNFLVMEYLEGETLAEQLERGALRPMAACRLLAQVATALEAAHRAGIVHRDLKPQNLFVVQPKDAEPQIKVLDFGIAKLAAGSEGPGVTQGGLAFGTPHFMSPEQCLGEPVDHRSDIYALGVVLYRTFTGRLPFEGRTAAEIAAQQLSARRSARVHARDLGSLPRALGQLIAACLATDPERRPRSCAEIAALLSALRFDGALAKRSPSRFSLGPGACLLLVAASTVAPEGAASRIEPAASARSVVLPVGSPAPHDLAAAPETGAEQHVSTAPAAQMPAPSVLSGAGHKRARTPQFRAARRSSRDERFTAKDLELIDESPYLP